MSECYRWVHLRAAFWVGLVLGTGLMALQVVLTFWFLEARRPS